MIPKECKRLAEVDFPIAIVSKHSAREKSIRHGHPCTLHLWWARRPLAACRSMLLALLLPDPCEKLCPKEFKHKARELLPELVGTIGPKDIDLRGALRRFIGDFANWDHSAHPVYLKVSRGLVKAAHPEETPLVVDPFAGGGSIPLEALRLGCDAFASDLNPVACLILKVMLEDIPRHGPELADELRRVGTEIKKKAEKELAGFYPKDPDGATPIAYLWARTVKCESPNCGAEIPLMRSFWLGKKAGRKRALRHKVVKTKGKARSIEFEIFEPKSESEVSNGTVTRAKATCQACGNVLAPERVRAQLAAQRGGADVVFDRNGKRVSGARLLAVVTLKPGERGRHYRLPVERDYKAVWKAQKRLKDILDEWEKGGRKGLCPVPDEPTPTGGGSGAGRAFCVQKYGMMKFGDLFTARQKVFLRNVQSRMSGAVTSKSDGQTLAESLAMVLGRVATYGTASGWWHRPGEKMGPIFGRPALPIVWDFAEVNPLAEATGAYKGALEWVLRVVEFTGRGNLKPGQVALQDACVSTLPSESVAVWFTDPPYYDAIPYSDLSDFFYAIFRRTIPGHQLLVNPFEQNSALTPKCPEIIQDEVKRSSDGRPKDRLFFEDRMADAFAEGNRILRQDGIGSVVFAHKTTEGWEALLGGLIRGGWVITGSWPVATEMRVRLRARESAALASSVHLICRQRPQGAPSGDWGEVLQELPKRVGDWMERLQREGVRGADLVFACIGPALEIFSRYSKVETAEGAEVKLDRYLEKVWEVVGRTALEQVLGTAEARARNSFAGALEEDARLTALFLWTLQSTNGNSQPEPSKDTEDGEADDDEEATAKRAKSGGYSLVFDVVRRFAQPLGIALPAWEGRIIETKKGVVRLLSIAERAKTLFGEKGAQGVATELESDPAKAAQFELELGIPDAAPKIKGGRRRRTAADITDQDLAARREATTLDRVHAAMLLQKAGRTNALRALLKAEQQRGPDFLRLANALSALYPKGSEEKRLLDAMLLAAGR
ncbi:MAG: DUF1156 domain-containing protein [Candidatus Zixiibacteriota bacterium]